MRARVVNQKLAWWIGLGVALLIIAVSQMHLRLGFNFGPYQVREGDTLYGILTRTFEGSQFHAAETLQKNNFEWDFNQNLIYANRRFDLHDGDTVTVRYNTLNVRRPDGEEFKTELVDEPSLHRRNVEVVFKNLLVLVAAAAVWAVVYLGVKHGKEKGFGARVAVSLGIGWVVMLACEIGLYVIRTVLGGYW